MSLGIKCPFCSDNLEMEFYSTGIKGAMGWSVVFCGNDKCPIKPCTDVSSPSKAIAEARFFGKTRRAVSVKD